MNRAVKFDGYDFHLFSGWNVFFFCAHAILDVIFFDICSTIAAVCAMRRSSIFAIKS